jgi:hypothetical protein
MITLGVTDLKRSFEFYHNGLGFPTTRKPESGWVAFQTGGVCLALFPYKALAQDAAAEPPASEGRFTGITLAHNTRTQKEVGEVLRRAVAAGGRLVKKATGTSWGGYGGYFADPDGYLWEVAWSADWKFHPDGRLVID